MKRLAFFSVSAFLLLCAFVPSAHAAKKYAPFEVSGWVPYWKNASGTADILPHVPDFTEINPFGYTVKSDGSLFDASGLESFPSSWTAVIAAAKAGSVRVLPTVMWSDGATIDAILRNAKSRAAHENAIVAMVKRTGSDGVDIDYEAKLPKTQGYFTLFLKELYAKLGPKWLECSVEARTPADLRRDPTPDDPKDYANNYAALNKYCDRVKLMTYDQASVDQKLTLTSNAPYIPVSDPRWVTEVVALAEKSISKSKIMIGIPTYGYEYKVTPLSSGYDYQLLWAFNPSYALTLASTLGIAPQRNVAGELSLTYRPQASTSTISPNTASVLSAATGVLDTSFNLVWWSDSQAIADKVALAKRLGVRGVSVFKIDGGEDPGIWNVLGK